MVSFTNRTHFWTQSLPGFAAVFHATVRLFRNVADLLDRLHDDALDLVRSARVAQDPGDLLLEVVQLADDSLSHPVRHLLGECSEQSSHSAAQGECVMVAFAGETKDLPAEVGIHDSKNPALGHFAVPAGAWEAFLATVK
jgi:hypothetical protein